MIAADNHLEKVSLTLDALELIELPVIIRRIAGAPMILICGNGGSAATAIHFASDLRSLGYPAFDMMSPSKFTQIDNDSGHCHPFREQAVDFPEALIIAFSGSGTSKNIAALAYERGENLILFTSDMKEFVYPQVITLRVPSADYEVIEDVHLALCHAIKKELMARKDAE